MSLSDVLHQVFAQRQLQRAVANGRVHHAYLFQGPDGVGKELFALELVRLLLCPNRCGVDLSAEQAERVGVASVVQGCGRCRDCHLLDVGSHPDWHIIYRQLHQDHPDPMVRKRVGLDIGVDVLRHFVMDAIGLKPIRGRAKVFVIREADRITPQAQNALLKTLEEPPPSTHIVLLAVNAERLLPTTLSRCQTLQFAPLPESFVRQKLTELPANLSHDQIGWYARTSNGSVGQAVRSIEDALYEMNNRLLEAWIDSSKRNPAQMIKLWSDCADVLAKGYKKRERAMNDTEAARQGFQAILAMVAGILSDAAHVAVGEQDRVVNRHRMKELTGWAGRVSTARLTDGISRVALAGRQLGQNANRQLVMECLVHEMRSLLAGSDNALTVR